MVIHLNGSVRDPEGHGVGGVLVSNGEHVVLTDLHGRYTIEALPPAEAGDAEGKIRGHYGDAEGKVRGHLGGHRFILVTVPDGYTADGGFYHPVPQSSGTLDFFIARDPARKSPEFTLAHVTDTHVDMQDGQPVGTDELREDLEQLKSDSGAALVVATGDLTEQGTLGELCAYDEVAKSAGPPIFPVFGAHDGGEEVKTSPGWGATCTGNYQKVLGPVCYSFDWGGRHFVTYANEDYLFSRYDLIYKERWLKQDLALQPEGRETVLMMHAPPSRQLLDRLQSYNVTLVLHGHTHSSKVFTYGRTTVSSLTPLRFGGADTNPRGYRAVRFKHGGFDFNMVPMGRVHRNSSPRPAVSNTESGLTESLVWKTTLPANVHRATPVLWDGDLLVSLQDESSRRENGVCRISASTGKEVWRVRTDSAVRNSVTIARNGACLAFTSAGRLYSIDATSGEVRWQVDTPEFPERWIATSPAVCDDAVYVGAKSGYAAYDLETGEGLWHTQFAGTMDLVADPTGDKWGCYASPLVYDDLIITFVPRRGLVALDRAGGRVVWELPIEGTDDYWAKPALVGNRLVTGGEPGMLIVLEAQSGKVEWRAEVMAEYEPYPGNSGFRYASGLTVDQNHIYATTSQGEVICCDLATGDLNWTFLSGHDLLDMTPGRRNVRSLLAAPAVTQGKLLVAGLDGVLYHLNATNGKRVGEARFDSPLTAAPCLLPDGFVVATWDGLLVRYRF